MGRKMGHKQLAVEGECQTDARTQACAKRGRPRSERSVRGLGRAGADGKACNNAEQRKACKTAEDAKAYNTAEHVGALQVRDIWGATDISGAPTRRRHRRVTTHPLSATKSLLLMRAPRSLITEALATANPMAHAYRFGDHFLSPVFFVLVSAPPDARSVPGAGATDTSHRPPR